ncbi:DUF2259 domain-containing protein [Aestuariivirga sp.]|uniref:DUF2259 domain-containing protein n=1 Tax=Aestuariivirga sp. TaxID=2650926 RepID=UPI0039E323B6
MRLRLAALLLLPLAGAAHAADGAQSRAIGFSPDNRYFAFEQYGVQDGSGFAYSDIFVIDLGNDTWVKGSPVRVQDESEDGNIDAARAKAIQQAKPVIDSVKATSAVDTLAYLPFTQVGQADRRKVRFARYYDSSGNPSNYDATGTWEIEVKDVALPAPADCTDLDIATPVGLEVTVKDVKSGKSITATRDTAIPKSRFCPHAYDIEAVFAPAGYGQQEETFVALIGVFSRGFEGSDRRFIAVPFKPPPLSN